MLHCCSFMLHLHHIIAIITSLLSMQSNLTHLFWSVYTGFFAEQNLSRLEFCLATQCKTPIVYCSVLCCVVTCFVALYCIVLHCIVLSCIVSTLKEFSQIWTYVSRYLPCWSYERTSESFWPLTGSSGNLDASLKFKT